MIGAFPGESELTRERILILVLLLIAFSLRIWGLADHNIWWDEGLANWAARLSVSDILHWTAHDVHPPLYFLLLHGWWLLVGDGEFALRFPSVLMGVLGVGLIYRLGRSLGGSKAGLLAALFLTLSRFAIAWSQEMRMYIWAATLATSALWAVVRLCQRSDWRAWIVYVTAVAGELWTLYLTISVPITANLIFPLVWLRRGRPRRLLTRWVVAQLVAAALFAPWLVYALPRIPTWSTAEPSSPLFFVHLYATMLAVGVPINLEVHTPLTLAALGVLVVGLVALWKSRRTPAQTGGLVMLVLGLVLPALVIYIISLPIHIYYSPRLAPRYFLPLSICFYTLLGWGLAVWARKRRWVSALASILVIAVALSGLASFYPGRARRDDYTSLAATLRAYRHPGDGVVLHTDKDWPIFAAHYAGAYRGVPNGASVNRATAARILAPLWEQREGVWLVVTPDAQRNDPAGEISAWLEARAISFRAWHFGESDLYFYARTPQRAVDLHDLAPDFVPPVGPAVEVAPGVVLLGAEVPLPRYRTGDTVHLFLYWAPPPRETIAVRTQAADGAVLSEVVVSAPVCARSSPTRQQVDLLLTSDLPGGHYQIVLQVGKGPAIEVGRFTLIRRSPAETVRPTDIPHSLDFHLGEHIRLLGYDLPQTVVEPGGVVELTLYWQAAAPVQARYKVFVHLLGQTYNATTGNYLWGQQDNEPVNGEVLTTMWVPGEVIADPYEVSVATDAPPGQYQVEVGMYGLVDGVRLPVLVDGVVVDDRVLLQPVEVVRE
ncbi:MAG TPA: hypothetical protein EYP49_21435 [Anaerolineae bacterium]|nr:hypothetical protein [Anaerolineae bacterium]